LSIDTWGGQQWPPFFASLPATFCINAVRRQVSTRLLVYLLLRYPAFLSEWNRSFGRLFPLVRVALRQKWDALHLLRRHHSIRPKTPAAPTLQSLVDVAFGVLAVRVPEHGGDLFDGEHLGELLGEFHLA